ILSKLDPIGELTKKCPRIIPQNNLQEEEESNITTQQQSPKDALFMEAKVARRKTNIMIDTGAVRNAVSKSFLDEIGLEIDGPSDRTLIGISGKITTPLGVIHQLSIKINTTIWKVEAAVMDSEAYSVILGNEWVVQEGEIGRTNAFKHKIYTEEGPPISQRAY
ncbi:16586_t:CDS:2, partial [Funneliformis geosporum]